MGPDPEISMKRFGLPFHTRLCAIISFFESNYFLSHAEAQRTLRMKYDFSSLSANTAPLRDNIILHPIEI